MKSKINVFQQKENPIHRWNVYNTFSESKDKYDLYFKNRFTVKNGGEKYDDFNTLSDDYVLYKLYQRGVGVQNSVGDFAKPDLVNFDKYTRIEGTYDNILPENERKYIINEKRLPLYIRFDIEAGEDLPFWQNTYESYFYPNGMTVNDFKCNWLNNERYDFSNSYLSMPIIQQTVSSNFILLPIKQNLTNDTTSATVINRNNEIEHFVGDNNNLSFQNIVFYLCLEGDYKGYIGLSVKYNFSTAITGDKGTTTNEIYPEILDGQIPLGIDEIPVFPIGGLPSSNGSQFPLDVFKLADIVSREEQNDFIYDYTLEEFPFFAGADEVGEPGYAGEKWGITLTIRRSGSDYTYYSNTSRDNGYALDVLPTDDGGYTVSFKDIECSNNPNYNEITYITAEGGIPTEITTKNVRISRIGANNSNGYYNDNRVYEQLKEDRLDRNGWTAIHGTYDGEDARGCLRYDIVEEEASSITRSGEIYRCKIAPFKKGMNADYTVDFTDWERCGANDLYGYYLMLPITIERSSIEGKNGLTEDNYQTRLKDLYQENGGYFNYRYPKEYDLRFIWNDIDNTIEVWADVYGTYTPRNYGEYWYWQDDPLFSGKVITFDTLWLSDVRTEGLRNNHGFFDYAWKVPIISTHIFRYEGSSVDRTSRDEVCSFIIPIQINKYANAILKTHTGIYHDIYGNAPTEEQYTKMRNGVIGDMPLGTSYVGFRNSPRVNATSIDYSIPVGLFSSFNGGVYETMENITMDVDDFNEFSNDFVNGEIMSFDGDISMNYIDVDSIRYGFSYDTEIFKPYSNKYHWESVPTNGYRAFISYTQLQNMYENGYSNSIGKPTFVYDLDIDTTDMTGTKGTYTENNHPDYQDLNGHPMGIKPYTYGLKTDDRNVVLQTQYNPDLKSQYIYEVIFEMAEPVPANTFYLLTADATKTNILPTYQELDPEKIYQINQSYKVVKPSTKIKEWKYTPLYQYNQSNEERWLTQIIYQFPRGMKVPTKHWPQMLYSTKRYKDVEVVGSDEMTYPNLGYYPPKEEMLPDNFKTELEEDEAIYRYIGNINQYYSTVKAGSIYLPVGTDIEEELHLTPYDLKYENDYIETNPYGYRYIGEESVVNKNALLRIATSTDFGAYPKDGVYSDNLWYEYIGTNEEVDYIGTEEELRSNPTYNIDINSSQDFTIGDVSGASFTVDIQGNVRDLIKYLGRKCKLFYDFENKGEYQDFGLFTIEDVKFMNHQVSTIVAYDNIKKFDAPVYEYLTSENVEALYPMTAKMLFQLMCEYCEVPYYTNMDFLNSDKLIYGPFGDANLTARQALSYIAEIAAGYIICDTNGYAILKTYKPYLEIRNDNHNYTTYNENIGDLIDNTNAIVNREVYQIYEQVNQRMDIFPTELIDSIVFNNIDTISFINYRKELNAIYDLSDNPFLTFVENQEEANSITDGILDQIAILIPVLYDTETAFYAGEIELKNFDYSTFGTKQVVWLLEEEKDYDYFIPTGIAISNSGIVLTSKGQPKYSTKIVNSELAKQVNSLKMSVKEVKLQIPDALSETLETHSEDISTIQSDLGGVQSDISTISDNVSTLDTNLSTLEGNVSSQNTANSNRFRTIESKDQEQDGRLDAIELKDTGYDTDIAAIQTKNTNQDTAISANATAISENATAITNLTTTVGGLPTKTYVDNLNQVNSITHGGKLSIGEDEVSFYTDNGYLFISDGTTTGKLKLEVNA